MLIDLSNVHTVKLEIIGNDNIKVITVIKVNTNNKEEVENFLHIVEKLIAKTSD